MEVAGSLHSMSIMLISNLTVQSTVVLMAKSFEVSGKEMMLPLRSSQLDF